MSKQAFKRVRRYLKMEVNRKPLDAFAWPGGYPLYYFTSDSSTLCPKCMNNEIESADIEIKEPSFHDQFRPTACCVNWEDDNLHCDHCYQQIESAYGDA